MSRSTNRALTVALVVVLIAVATIAALQAYRAADERSDAQRTRNELRFVVAWGSFVESIENEYGVQSAALLGFAGEQEVSDATAARRAAEADSLEIFDELSGSVGDLADFVAVTYRNVAGEADPATDDFYLRTTGVLWSIDRWGLAADADAVHDIFVANQLPRLIASDRLLVVALEDFEQLPRESQSWFAVAPAAAAGGFGGWIYDDAHPFAEFVDLDFGVAPTLPETFAAIGDVAVGDDFAQLARSDAWIAAWNSHGGANPPNDTATLLASADAVEAQITALATDSGTAGVEAATDEAADRTRQLIGSLLLFGLSAGALVAFAGWRYRRLARRAYLWRRDAGIDSLTGVANSRALDDWAHARFADPHPGHHALIMIDIDRFKTVNDTYGHLAGDGLLQVVGARLVNELNEWREATDRSERDAILARLGGDEFVVMLHDVMPESGGAIELAERLRAAASRPASVSGIDLHVATSGAVAYSHGESSLLDLRIEADLALYQAKQGGGDQVRVFDDPVVHEILSTIHRGDAGGNIDAHLQPIFHLDAFDEPEYEALARWTGRDGEVIAAERWLQPLQRAGESGQLLKAMIDNVAEIFRTRPEITGRIWLNIGPADIGSEGADRKILAMMEEAGLDSRRTGIEIVETAPISDIEATAANLRTLRSAGILVAVDDFGSGFTPIGHLVALPFDVVKLDRSVVAAIDTNEEQAALVAATVDICNSLSLELVAEGVERVAELDKLIDLGVGVVQGYLFHRPAAADAFPAMVTRPLGREESKRPALPS